MLAARPSPRIRLRIRSASARSRIGGRERLRRPLVRDEAADERVVAAVRRICVRRAPFCLHPGLFCGQPVAFLLLPPCRFRFRVRFGLPLFLFKGLAFGLEICSGGIAGMGETDDDLIDLAFALREVQPDSIPMNFLHPVPGTPMQDQNNLTPQRCLKILCLFRFLHPRTELRVAGGREFNLRSLQALALYPADSLFVGGYLTTPGMPAPEAWKMIEDLGFEVDTVGTPVA